MRHLPELFFNSISCWPSPPSLAQLPSASQVRPGLFGWARRGRSCCYLSRSGSSVPRAEAACYPRGTPPSSFLLQVVRPQHLRHRCCRRAHKPSRGLKALLGLRFAAPVVGVAFRRSTAMPGEAADVVGQASSKAVAEAPLTLRREDFAREMEIVALSVPAKRTRYAGSARRGTTAAEV